MRWCAATRDGRAANSGCTAANGRGSLTPHCRLRYLQSPEEEQSGSGGGQPPYEPSAASVVALTAQALSEACAEELAALGTTVEHDELELQVRAWGALNPHHHARSAAWRL